MITKEMFDKYESVRLGGKTNMFDIAVVSQFSGLTKSEILEIMKNYNRYNQVYGGNK